MGFELTDKRIESRAILVDRENRFVTFLAEQENPQLGELLGLP
jgi:hypothetical protein